MSRSPHAVERGGLSAPSWRARSGARAPSRWCRNSCLGLPGRGVEVVGCAFLGVGDRLRLVERLRLLGFLRQTHRRFAYVELSGDDIGDQAGAVFSEKR